MIVLSDLVREGKVLAVGVSNFGPDLLERSQQSLSPVPLASTQPKYSLLDRRIEKDVIPWICDNNVGAIVYSPLEQGLLSGKVTADRQFPASDGRNNHPLFDHKNRLLVLQALEKIQPIADAHNLTLAQLSIAWCFHQPGITAAIVGARSATQAIENAAACHTSLSETELIEIASVFSKLDCSR